MGVKGLWRLLLPIGRRISVETLEGKILAIDASIWLAQFLNAMRDPDTGSVKEAAHLIGFFRRLAKLRFHGIRPVLVFDGATPEIKIREIQARRRRREQFASHGPQGIQRLAKRLLVQELKKMKSGNKKKDQGALAASFNLPDEELQWKTTEGGDEVQRKQRIAQPSHETSEEIARALQEEEWNTPNDEDEPLESDWDLVERMSSQKPRDDGRNDTNDDDPDLILQHLSSMSPHARKDTIEEAKRRQRLKSRREFMPVAGQPEDYSQVQLRNFLLSSRLNQTIARLATDAAAKDNYLLPGEAVASDSTRRIIFEKYDALPSKRLIKMKQLNDSGSEEEQWIEEGKTPKRLLDSDDDEETRGGFLREVGFMKSAPVAKRIIQSDTDDSDDNLGGFLFDKKLKVFLPIDDRASDGESGGKMMDKGDTSETRQETQLRRKDHSHIQEIEDEMLARAIYESVSRESRSAFAEATVKKCKIHPDEPFARHLQDKEQNIRVQLIATVDDAIVVEDDECQENDQKLPAKPTLPEDVLDSDGDDIDWEDGIHEVEQLDAPNTAPKSLDEGSEEDHVDWEGGKEIIIEAYPTEVKELTCEMSDMHGIVVNDFSSPIQNRNEAALEQAQATAANLTNWAGRAFRRAIAAHTEEAGKQAGMSAFVSTTTAADHAKVFPSQPDKGMERLTGSEPVFVPVTKDPHKIQITSEAPESALRVMPSLPPMDSFETGSAPLLQKEDKLEAESQREERDMETVTDEMKAEIIHLIQLFGIPFVDAPAEAEAQCAALEELGLVDGIVTEDSDVFLFGGKTIYRHIFDDQKYVEVYLARDAERDLALSRNQFVGLAMLLGSDYTDGVKGVGIVNGMEILQAFDLTNGVKVGLSNFREWLNGFDPGEEFGSKDIYDSQSPERKFHMKHRSARQRWLAPSNFPSDAALNAYLNPVVDKSEGTFSWGTPDLDGLVEFCQRNMEWEAGDTKAIVQPILERMNVGMRQTRMESFFMKYEDSIKFANVKSKRLREVFHKIQGENIDIKGRANQDENEGDQKTVGAQIACDAATAPPAEKRRKTNSKRGRPRGVK